MPDVIGQRLDVALKTIKGAGFPDDVDIEGGGTFGVVDESNWKVCAQSPMSGKAMKSAPRLTVDRSCGDDDPDPVTSSTRTTTTTTTGKPTGSSTLPPSTAVPADSGEILTVDNNTDLAAILREPDSCAKSIGAFAARYKGRSIAFDGGVSALANHESYQTRYDILIYPGDTTETAANGPAFQFRDVGMADLHLTGSTVPDSISVGSNVRVIARVDTFVEAQCLLILDPISTEIR